MKRKLLLTAFALTVLTSNIYAVNNYYFQFKDPGPYGSGSVSERSGPNPTGGTNYTIDCVGSGENMCQAKDGKCPPSVIDAKNDVLSRVESGEFMGNITTEWGDYNWSAPDIHNIFIAIRVN